MRCPLFTQFRCINCQNLNSYDDMELGLSLECTTVDVMPAFRIGCIRECYHAPEMPWPQSDSRAGLVNRGGPTPQLGHTTSFRVEWLIITVHASLLHVAVDMSQLVHCFL